MWDHDDDIQFRIEDERIVIRNVTIENEQQLRCGSNREREYST